jgi:hypothetical protein
MLNFYPPFLFRVLAAILKMADILKILKTQNCSSNGDLSIRSDHNTDDSNRMLRQWLSAVEDQYHSVDVKIDTFSHSK